YRPVTPRNKSHREEAILLKDLIKDALEHRAGRGRRNGSPAFHSDLERIASVGEQLRGNGSNSKAIFACGELGIWREFNLPVLLPQTRLAVDVHFHLKPLAELVASAPRCCVAVVDREHATIFDSWLHELSGAVRIENAIPRRVKTAGFAGYE